LCFLTEWSCYQGREVTQTDEGAEEQDQEDPWCEKGQYQSTIANILIDKCIPIPQLIDRKNFADEGWRRQEEVRDDAKLAVLTLSILVCLGRFACGIPECFVVRTIEKEFASLWHYECFGTCSIAVAGFEKHYQTLAYVPVVTTDVFTVNFKFWLLKF
jgi:hypothetical protein